MKKLAQVFKALSDETRLRILALLTRGELCVCNLTDVLQAPQSTVSRHLAYLRNAGLVSDRREGVSIFYCLKNKPPEIDSESWKALLALVSRHEQAASDFAALDYFLAQKQGKSSS